MKAFSNNDIFRNQATYYPKYRWVNDLSENQFILDNSINRYSGSIEGIDLYEIAVNGLSSAYQYIVNKKQYQTYAGQNLSEYQYGQHVTASLIMTSSIAQEQVALNADRPHILALKNTFNYYTRLARSFDYSNFASQSLAIFYIPTIFYGSSLKRGSVSIKYFTQVDNRLATVLSCTDSNKNGELINITSSFYGTSSSCVGNILYNEGIIILNKSNHFTQASDYISLEYNGTVKQNQIMLFATADKNEFNNSNNPTYKNTLYKSPSTSSNKFIEDPKQLIYNINSSSYANYDESYKKITYISSIGLFDKDRNLIGIAKLSKPIRKRQEDSFTFKLRYDML